jgi:tenellin biosynthesis cytochrome P450 monooxygenase
MPENSVDWAMTQPDDVLSVTQAFLEVNQTEYSLGHQRYWGDAWQFSLVKTQLNSILQNLIPSLNDELRFAFDKHFGTDTETWKEIPLENTLRMIVAQASSRFIVGQPLCRNDDYLKLTYKIIDGVMLTAFVSGTFPSFLRPIAGRLASWHTRRNIEKVKKIFEPLYRERLETLKYEKDDPAHPQPQDQLQMMLRFAQKKRAHELNDLEVIATRLCAANFVSMHQTTITATNMLLNIISSNAEFNTIAVLRDEVKRVLGVDGSDWTKDKFAQMTMADSVARETMRVNFPFGNRGLLRKVMKDGVVTKDGIKLEKGTLISYLASPAQIDPEKFDDPLKYDPFRFSREQEAATDGKPGSNSQAFVSTSPQYLPFGHGRHACPGRFMVDFELKMIVAYLLKHYDIEFPSEYGGKRPDNVWMAELAIPPPGARVRVKRRKNGID